MQKIDFLIVGGGLAGARVAGTLRKEKAQGRIVILAAEPELPYDHPPLSKDFLRGETPRARVFLHPASFYKQKRIEVWTDARAVHLDTQHRQVTLSNGEELSYGQLLLATGSLARRLAVPGAELEGIHYLRTLADSERIKSAAASARRVAVIGGGFIGAEVAASLTQKGLSVTLIDTGRVLWSRLFGEELGRFFHRLLVDQGVSIISDERVARLEGDRRVERVVTQSGTIVTCDFVVAGIGVTPDTALAEQAGLAVENGVLVDEYMQTSMPGVFAAGDIARHFHPLFAERLRVEHWQNAIDTGEVAARNMLGRREPIVRAPYFFSDLFDVSMEYVGHVDQWDELIIRGSTEAKPFSAFFVREGRIMAALLVNSFAETDAARALVEGRTEVASVRDRLAEPGTPLTDLVPMGAGRS